jgi:hypothetical protein
MCATAAHVVALRSAMIADLVAHADEIDVVVAPGDLTMVMPFGRSPAESTCDCLAQGPPVAGARLSDLGVVDARS